MSCVETGLSEVTNADECVSGPLPALSSALSLAIFAKMPFFAF